MSKKEKFRPVFTLEQLERISALCKMQQPITQTDAEIIGILAAFIAKAQNGAIAAAYAIKPKLSLEQSLGFAPTPNQELTHAHRRYAAYEKYSVNPASCTLEEISLAETYRYENDLMSQEEAVAFETKMLSA